MGANAKEMVAVRRAWLPALALETELLSRSIAELGEALSSRTDRGGDARMQQFDLLAQQAGAIAVMLAGLEGAASPAALIEAMPFHAARQRLLAALQEAPAPALADVETGTDWF